MQPAEEMSVCFWRHGVTVHMRIFVLETCRAIQWWHESHSDTVYVPKVGALSPTFNGQTVMFVQTVQHSPVELPPIPTPVDNEKFHSMLQQKSVQQDDISKHMSVVSQMLDLTDSTSDNEINRTLALHRAKHKLRAFAAFQKK